MRKLSCGHDIPDQFGRCCIYNFEEGYCSGVLVDVQELELEILIINEFGETVTAVTDV